MLYLANLISSKSVFCAPFIGLIYFVNESNYEHLTSKAPNPAEVTWLLFVDSICKQINYRKASCHKKRFRDTRQAYNKGHIHWVQEPLLHCPVFQSCSFSDVNCILQASSNKSCITADKRRQIVQNNCNPQTTLIR